MNIRISLLASLTLILSGVALAQDPQVESANPSSAPQGTQLDVEIGGDGFDNSAAVSFFVTGTTNPGGITVTNVKVRGPKKIIASIAIDAEAEVTSFDIEVALSRGRTGKGTELFAVQENTNQGQGENAAGIATILTDPLSSQGIFSDQFESPTPNNQYVSADLAGDGTPDCASVIVPARDGVDGGKAQIFVRAPDGECAVGRKFLVRGSGFDLDKDGTVETDELVERKFMCFDTFNKDTLPGDEVNVECTLFVEVIDEDARVDRHFRFEWRTAMALHVSDDVRRVTAQVAHVFEFVPPTKGKGKKQVIEHGPISMHLDVEFERVLY